MRYVNPYEEHLLSKHPNISQTRNGQHLINVFYQYLTYGTEIVTLTEMTAKKHRVKRRQMDRTLLRLTLNDRIRNEEK